MLIVEEKEIYPARRIGMSTRWSEIVATLLTMKPGSNQSFLLPATTDEEVQSFRASINSTIKRKGIRIATRIEKDYVGVGRDGILRGVRVWRTL